MGSRGNRTIAVIGGGIAGLSVAWRLAQVGMAVTVFKGHALASSGAATWASAGMICAQLEMTHASPNLARFALLARSRWPDFAGEMEAASDVSCGFVQRGALHVALSQADRLHARPGVEWIGGDAARLIEPALGPHVRAALWAPDEAHVEPRLVARALTEACRRAGVVAVEDSPVERIVVVRGRVYGVLLAGGPSPLAFDHVVLAAGAWSSTILAQSGLPGPSIVPVKGETLSLEGDPAALPLTRIVWTDRAYIAPHADGRIVIGATQARVGFEMSSDEAELQALRASAVDAVPALGGLAEQGRAIGFRPASADDAPTLGGIGVDGLTLASGQFRNGILFAPLVAEAAAAHALHGQLPDYAQPFAASRLMLEAT